MTRDDIIGMARDVGAHATNFNGRWTFYMGELELFAEIVAAAEREACLRECQFGRSSADIEIAIRARGEK